MPESAELQQFLDRITAPDATHLNAYRTLIDGIVADGNWTGIDALYVISSTTATTFQNLKSSSFTLTQTGTVAFVADRGLTSDGSTGWLDTHYNPSVQVSGAFGTDGSQGFLLSYNRTDVAGFTYDVHSGGNISYLVPSFGGGMYGAIGGTGPSGVSNASTIGIFMVSRTSINSTQLYKNCLVLGTSDPSATIGGNSTNIAFLATAAGANFSTRQSCAFAFGAGLFDLSAYKLMARINAYMVAIGASTFTTPSAPVDTTNPSVTVNKKSDQADPTTAAPVNFTATFNEPVTGFSGTDVSFTGSTVGGTLSAIVGGGPTTYNIAVTGMVSTAGNVVASIPASVCVDLSGNPNNASTSTDNIVAWSPPPKLTPREITMVAPDLIRVEVRDLPVTHGFTEVLSSPDTGGGSGVYPITGALNNGRGQISVFSTKASSIGAIFIQNMVASPISNGAGGSRIRCTVFDTTLLPVSTRVKIYHALGTTEANVLVQVDSGSVDYYPYWSIAIIDATHFDLKYRMHYVASVLTEDTTLPSTFTNTYLGNGVVMDGNDGQSQPVMISGVGGCTEANGAHWPSRDGVNSMTLLDTTFVNSYTSGGQAIPCGAFETARHTRTNPSTGQSELCLIIGRESKQRRFMDQRATTYLDRPPALVAANYGAVGSRTITNVYHKSTPYSGGLGVYAGNPAMMPAVSFRHYLYLQLDGNLPNGSYTIDFPAAANIQDTAFTFNDKVTRCCSIKADQNGHRPGDAAKFAYLSEWVPGKGTYGEVSFASVAIWHIINSSGTIVWTAPGAPAQRATPTSIEMTGPYQQAPFAYPQPVELKVSMVTKANPARVTLVDASTIANGDTVMFTGMTHQPPGLAGNTTGMGTLDYQFLTVSNKSGNSFDINLDTTGYAAFTTSTTGNQGNLCYKCNPSGNRAGTYVYGLDFTAATSALTSAGPGTYYIYIPGYGVSDPLRISDARWYEMLKVYHQGMYHERAGCALDGRFGYTRPVTFKNRPEQPVRKSYMPYVFCRYANLNVASLDIGENFGGIAGGYSPFRIEATLDGGGGHMDAGDWDTRFYECAPGYYMALDVFERIPSTGRSVNVGLPTCLEIGLDPTIFAGTNALPSTLVEVIWGIEFQRASQETSGAGIGAVWGGLNYGEGVPDYQTSWNTVYPIYAYYPDHLTTYEYAGVAAKLAKVLSQIGYTALSTTYQNSAVAAFNWAETIYNRSSATARDAWYLPVKTAAGWTTTQYNTVITNSRVLDTSCRGLAAACLFALTGSTTYKTICDSMFPFGSFAPREADPMWEYCNAPGATSAIASGIKTQLCTWGLDFFVTPTEAADMPYTCGQQRAIYNAIFGGANTWIENMAAIIKAAMTFDAAGPDHDTAKAARCRAAIQRIVQHRHGANQMGFCLTNGLGVRNIKETLHLDSRYFNQDVPNGLTCEAWDGLFPFAMFLIFGTTPICRVQQPEWDPESVAVEPDTLYRELYPKDQVAWPRWESLIEYNTAIMHMEYTTQQQVLPGIATALYLHAYDGNNVISDGGSTPTAAYQVQRPLMLTR